MGKLLKITTVYGKILAICENFRKKATTWHALQKKGNGWMEMDGWKWMCKMDVYYG